MKEFLVLPNMKEEDIQKILSLFKHYTLGAFITKSHLIDRTGISDEIADEFIESLIEKRIIEKQYIFWCTCDEEQLNIISESEYNELDYEMCEYCEKEYTGEIAKKHYKLNYKFIVDISELCSEKKETNSSQVDLKEKMIIDKLIRASVDNDKNDSLVLGLFLMLPLAKEKGYTLDLEPMDGIIRLIFKNNNTGESISIEEFRNSNIEELSKIVDFNK